MDVNGIVYIIENAQQFWSGAPYTTTANGRCGLTDG